MALVSKRKGFVWKVYALLVGYGVLVLLTQFGLYKPEGPLPLTGRHLLQDEPENCSLPSIDRFPNDFMTEEQRKNGGIVFHMFVSLYILAGLAVVCDDYFVAALEKTCNVLKLQTDVAGATFMAAGSSSPELFTAIVGVFFAKSDVGIGTILGSAVFNLLFNLSLCALFSGMIIHLTWWPVLRDLLCYSVSIVVLVVVMHDDKIIWYESLVMVLLYVCYCTLMYFNPRLGNFCVKKVEEWQAKRRKGDKQPLLTEEQPLTPPKRGKSYGGPSTGIEEYGIPEGVPRHPVRFSRSVEPAFLNVRSLSRHLSTKESEDEEEEYESPMNFPDSAAKRAVWILLFPINLVFFLTIPDCKRPGCWKKTFPVTFAMSLVWIGFMSYTLVWMVTIIGATLGIPDTVMGLTLLAAGTSVPDALASLFVARDGYGDMAVSNSIGSNVFDILLGLGLPWLIQTLMVDPLSSVRISNSGLVFSALALLASVIFLLVAIILNKWKLTKPLGGILLVGYVTVVVISCLYMVNIFGGVVILPPC